MSFLRAQALEHFVREIEAFKLDHGHETGHTLDDRINGFRLGLSGCAGERIWSRMAAAVEGAGDGWLNRAVRFSNGHSISNWSDAPGEKLPASGTLGMGVECGR